MLKSCLKLWVRSYEKVPVKHFYAAEQGLKMFGNFFYNVSIFVFRKRAEYCFESTVSVKRTHRASLSFAANLVSSAKNSVSSLCHTNNRMRGTQ